jgi:hypothetical protein
MTWGVPTALFLPFHVAVSLLGIATGLVVFWGLLSGRTFSGWTGVFLAALVSTSITGFPLPPFGFDPARATGVISLILLAIAIAARYGFRLSGAWRSVFVTTAIAALYLDVFVGVTQAFQKLAFLRAVAPTQSEPPFLITQLVVLTAFVAFGVLAVMRFRPGRVLRQPS